MIRMTGLKGKSLFMLIAVMMMVAIAGSPVFAGNGGISKHYIDTNFTEKIAYMNQQFSFDVTTEIDTNINPSDLKYKLSGKGLNSPPPSMQIDKSTGMISGWVPTAPASHKLLVNVSHCCSSVSDVGSFKVFTPYVDTHFTDKTMVEGNEFIFDASTEVDTPVNVDYYLVSAPSGMQIDSSTGNITGWIPNNPTTETVVVNVTNSSTVYDSGSFDIEVDPAVGGMRVTPNTLMIGGSSASRTFVYTKDFTVENNGTAPLTGLDAVAVDTQGSPLASKYASSTNLTSSSVAPGDSMTGTLSINIPEDAPADKMQIGELNVTGNASGSTIKKFVDLDMEAESLLHIEKVEVEVNDDKDDVNHGDEVDVEIGDDVTVFVTLENRYASNTELEDAHFTMEDDGDWDVDESSYERDIDDGDEETFEVSFTVPSDADDEDVDMSIEASAVDSDYSFLHEADFEVGFKFDKKTHEVVIDSAEFLRNPVDCRDRHVDFRATMENIGKNDEDDVVLEVNSDADELDFEKRVTGIHLDEGDMTAKTVSVPLPRNMSESSYRVDLELYYDTDHLSNGRSLTLDVMCDGQGGVNVANGSDDEFHQQNGSRVYGEEVFPDSGMSTGYIIFLVIIGIAFLLVVGYLIYRIFIAQR